MSERYNRLNLYLTNAETALGLLKDKGHSYLNSDNLYQILVYQTGHVDGPTGLIDEMLSVDQMIVFFKQYIDENGTILAEIRFDIDERDLPPDDKLEKATVKMDGHIWRIHKNDADPFPSKPHAHLVGSTLKLHLGNGELYEKGKLCDKLRKKTLLELRDVIKEKTKIILPPLEV